MAKQAHKVTFGKMEGRYDDTRSIDVFCDGVMVGYIEAGIIDVGCGYHDYRVDAYNVSMWDDDSSDASFACEHDKRRGGSPAREALTAARRFARAHAPAALVAVRAREAAKAAAKTSE